MTRNTAALALVALFAAGCNGGDTDTAAETCDNSYAPYPADGTQDAYYRTTVEAKFEEVDDSASITVTGPSGDVAGSTSWRENTLVFTPDSPLEPSQSYTTTVNYTCGESAVSWATSSTGSPVDEASLLGTAFKLDITAEDVRFVQPAGVGDILKQQLASAGDVSILLGIDTIESGTIRMLGAVGSEDNSDVQEPCEPTIPIPPADEEAADFSENPYFQVGPSTTEFNVAGYSIVIDDLFISGAFTPNIEAIQGAQLAGSIDTRPLVPLIDEDAEEAYICDLAYAIGVSCEACPEDGEAFCLTLEVHNITAYKVDDPITPIEDPCELDECRFDSEGNVVEECQEEGGV